VVRDFAESRVQNSAKSRCFDQGDRKKPSKRFVPQSKAVLQSGPDTPNRLPPHAKKKRSRRSPGEGRAAAPVPNGTSPPILTFQTVSVTLGATMGLTFLSTFPRKARAATHGHACLQPVHAAQSFGRFVPDALANPSLRGLARVWKTPKLGVFRLHKILTIRMLRKQPPQIRVCEVCFSKARFQDPDAIHVVHIATISGARLQSGLRRRQAISPKSAPQP
jgi:hypothetical protein